MERVAPTGRSGRPFGQSISQQYQDLRTNPMGNSAHGSHSARNTGDNGQENSNGSSRKRIALACSRCRKRKIKCSGDPGNGQGCSNCKSNSQEQCQFLRVSSMNADFAGPSTVPVTWPYTNAGTPVSYLNQARASESSYGYSRGAGDLHTYAMSPQQVLTRSAGSLSHYPAHYRQSYPSSLYDAQEDWSGTRYSNVSSDYSTRANDPNTIWNPVNSQAEDQSLPASTVTEETSSSSFSGFSNMAGTLPLPAQGPRTLPQPGQKMERASLPRPSNASSSLSSDLPLSGNNYRSRPSWQSNTTGSSLGPNNAASTDLTPQDAYDVSSDNSSVSPIHVGQRATYSDGTASTTTYDELADQSRAPDSSYSSAFNNDGFLGGRDPYIGSLYTYSVSNSSNSGSMSEAQCNNPQLLGNGETYTRLPPQRTPAPPPSDLIGGEHQKTSSALPALMPSSGRGRRY